MQNATNNSQAFYTKPNQAPSSSAPQQPQQQNNPSKETMSDSSKPKSNKKKTIFAVAGILVFVIVALMGVLIAQRQVDRDGDGVQPVAPNAPESQPSASTDEPNYCATTFTVPQPDVVCDTKKALTDFTENRGEEIPVGSEFNVGDEMVFSITILQPTDGLVSDIVLVDTLPNSLVFVEGPSDPSYTLTVDGQTVTATIAEMGASSAVKVEFKVRVVAQDYGNHINTARITSNSTEPEPGSCTYSFTTLESKVACIEKQMYDLNGELVPSGNALTRGEEYEYRITVAAQNRAQGEVKIYDELPASLEYVGPADDESAKYITNDPSSGLLTANFGVLNNEEITLRFRMSVPDSPALGEFENEAKVYAFPIGSRQPEPPSNADICSVAHTILPIGTAECLSKEALTGFGGTVIEANSEVDPGTEFVYRITVFAEETTTGPVVLTDTLPADLTFIEDANNTEGLSYNANTREIEMNLGVMQEGQEEIIEFLVQLSADPTQETFTNEAVIVTNTDSEHVCAIPLEVTPPVYECNSECESNADCSDIPGGTYICHETVTGNVCRLESNPENQSCEEPQGTPTPTPTPTPTGSATPTPTPVVTPTPGCNELCTSNADCSNSSHICATTSDGSNRCRLAEFVESNTCTVPQITTTTQGTPTPQPELPAELPETGPAEWLQWIKVGLVTLGVGTALFLLL